MNNILHQAEDREKLCIDMQRSKNDILDQVITEMYHLHGPTSTQSIPGTSLVFLLYSLLVRYFDTPWKQHLHCSFFNNTNTAVQ